MQPLLKLIGEILPGYFYSPGQGNSFLTETKKTLWGHFYSPGQTLSGTFFDQ